MTAADQLVPIGEFWLKTKAFYQSMGNEHPIRGIVLRLGFLPPIHGT